MLAAAAMSLSSIPVIGKRFGFGRSLSEPGPSGTHPARCLQAVTFDASVPGGCSYQPGSSS
jgi:hypothetical protein